MTRSGWAFHLSRARRSTGRQHQRQPAETSQPKLDCDGAGRTVLSELCGRELRGDPEGLLGAALEDEAGGDAGAAGEVLFTAGQAQVEGVVTERGVLVTLRTVTWTNSSHTS